MKRVSRQTLCWTLGLILFGSTMTFGQTPPAGTSTAQAPTSTAESPLPSSQLIYPHVTVDADTTEYQKVSFRPFPGSYQRPDTGYSRTLTSTLSYGLFPRFEIGTIPVLYIVDRTTINFTTKLNVFRTDTSSIGIGFTYIDVDYRNPNSDIDLSAEKAHVQTSFFSAMLNFRPLLSRWSYGITTIINPLTIKGDDTRRETLMDNRLDVSRELQHNFYATVGVSATESPDFFSRFRSTGYFGVGGSLTWVRPGKLFSAPAIGLHHYPNYKGRTQNEFILTTTFF